MAVSHYKRGGLAFPSHIPLRDFSLRKPSPLQLVLARGHHWLRILETSEAATMCNNAHREGTNLRYVARHINLTLLVPDIVSRILDKTLSEGVQLLSLATNPPMLWEDQRRWRAGITG